MSSVDDLRVDQASLVYAMAAFLQSAAVVLLVVLLGAIGVAVSMGIVGLFTGAVVLAVG